MLRKPDEFPSPLPLEDGLAEFNRLSTLGWGERLYQSSLDRSDLTEAATEMIRDILDRNEIKIFQPGGPISGSSSKNWRTRDEPGHSSDILSPGGM
jgi:hypothetical protein